MALGACEKCGCAWGECECKRVKVCIYLSREIRSGDVEKTVEKRG
jgi:hypothetical protein